MTQNLQQNKKFVKHVFNKVFDKYDLMNDIMSFGIHRIWKDLMMDWLVPRPGQKLIDVAGGTGDIATRFLDRCKGDAHVKIVDFTEEMIALGKRKTENYIHKRHLDWFCADAMQLPFSGGIFDSYAISFGLRNVVDIKKALEESYRVLRPGGRIMILEFSTLVDQNLQWLYDKYSFEVIPWLGKFIAKDKESYQYLVESIRNFPKQNELVDLMTSVGFKEVKYRNLSMGIVALHSGWKL